MNLSDCSCDTGMGHLERVRYFSRQLLDAHDLTDDQAYHRSKQRLHNRLLHGWGIVCGLEVKPNPTTKAPLNVTICPGFALSPQGDEICVPAEVQFDLANCTAGPAENCCSSPCSPIVSGHVDPAKPFWLGIKYVQCPSRPVRVPPVACGCDDTACEYSRIRDSFEVSCLDTLPPTHDSKNRRTVENLCDALVNKRTLPCPPCPDNPWIVIAMIDLSAGSPSISAANIKTDDRWILLSAAMMQQDILDRCLG